jgi:hypothetical protein
MTIGYSRILQFVDGIAASVAVVGRDESRVLIISANRNVGRARPRAGASASLPCDAQYPGATVEEIRQVLMQAAI